MARTGREEATDRGQFRQTRPYGGAGRGEAPRSGEATRPASFSSGAIGGGGWVSGKRGQRCRVLEEQRERERGRAEEPRAGHTPDGEQLQLAQARTHVRDEGARTEDHVAFHAAPLSHRRARAAAMHEQRGSGHGRSWRSWKIMEDHGRSWEIMGDHLPCTSSCRKSPRVGLRRGVRPGWCGEHASAQSTLRGHGRVRRGEAEGG